MKKVLFITVFVALLLPAFSFAIDIESDQQGRTVCISLLSSNPEEITANEIERSGCCSWHGGVCGCQYGRALCCDGTLSPSCGCD